MNDIHFIENVTMSNIGRLIDKIEKVREKEPDKPITLYVASGGGNPAAAIAFYQYVMARSIPITTVALGEVCSAAITIFLAGKERLAVQDAHFLLHSLRAATLLDRLVHHLVYPIFWPSVKRERDINFKILNDQKERVCLKRTRLSQKDLERIRRGFLWLSAGEALKKGIIHKIVPYSPGA